jgi:cyclic pyranopterin phosphate synthase
MGCWFNGGMSESRKLSHADEKGQARMVDVSGKSVTVREAVAEGFIVVGSETLLAIAQGKVPKGEVINTARVAGIMAAKRCGELIPLCHPLGVESVEVGFELPGDVKSGSRARIRIEATAKISGKTGVEMEALTAVSIAALTIYDMCKAIDKEMVIEGIRLIKKTGGKSDLNVM